MQDPLEHDLLLFMLGFLTAELALAWRFRRHPVRPPARGVQPLVAAEDDWLDDDMADATSQHLFTQVCDPEATDAD